VTVSGFLNHILIPSQIKYAPPHIFTIKNIFPKARATIERPRAAKSRYIISPSTMPQITVNDGRNPDASALATVAKTPGPGLAARTSMATENPIAE
jgi:hypothetical protein